MSAMDFPDRVLAPDVTILMPRIEDWARTNTRYQGLIDQLGTLGLTSVLVEGIASFDPETGVFPKGHVWDGQTHRFVPINASVTPGVVRDLTMALGDRPLYRAAGATMVHDPRFNSFMADKLAVFKHFSHLQPETHAVTNTSDLLHAMHALPGDIAVVKPLTGQASDGVVVDQKAKVASVFEGSKITKPYLVQAFVESNRGIESLDISGRHNLRVILIGGVAVFGFGRLAEQGSYFINNDPFGPNLRFLDTSEFPELVQHRVQDVIDGLGDLPDGINGRDTVIAADFMAGTVAGKDEGVYLCELNRRPLRNSVYDAQNAGTVWASRQWDVHEARLLASFVADSRVSS